MRCVCSLVVVLVAIAGASGRAASAETATLVPFIGETVQEFEARSRGIKLKKASQEVVVVSADSEGHFVVHPMLEGRRVRMLVDTGATVVALTHEDAQLAGIQVSERDFARKMSTANGIVEVAPVRIAAIQVGDIVVHNVEAVILPPGRLAVSLLGMTFLNRLGGFDISQGRMRLRE